MTLAAKAARRNNPARETPDAVALLAWYDRHRRRLPWRALPGETADPYRVWLSEIMLQQTTVRTVAPYYEKFLTRWPSVAALAAADLEDVLRMWAGLGYYARARNLHACARTVAERHGGVFPRDEAGLAALPGIGPYTAAAIAAIAFDIRSAPVDGNIERVVTRLFAIAEELPAAKAFVRARVVEMMPARRCGDFAQALMDLGATICTPKTPACALCPWMIPCVARVRGEQETFPRKAPKANGKLRSGAAFVVTRADGRVLVRSRPEKGLLGGMTEFPGTEWVNGFDEADALAGTPLPRVQWRRLIGRVQHTFTHFPLELSVYAAEVGARVDAPAGMRWVKLDDLAGEALPTVMRKVAALALTEHVMPQSRNASTRGKKRS